MGKLYQLTNAKGTFIRELADDEVLRSIGEGYFIKLLMDEAVVEALKQAAKSWHGKTLVKYGNGMRAIITDYVLGSDGGYWETVVMPADKKGHLFKRGKVLDKQVYHTEDQARMGHSGMVWKWNV